MPTDEDPILPTIGHVIGRAKERLVEVRPRAAGHIERGKYATVFAGWRGQFAKARSRLADEVRAARLPFSSGVALTELARSEYDTPRNEQPTKAAGEVVLTRSVVHSSAGATITTADATDGATVEALLQTIAAWANEHILDVYSAVTGLGTHQTADSSGTFSVTTTNMGTLVSSAKTLKDGLNWHFANRAVVGGASGTFHKDADTLSTITASDAFASASGSAFSLNSAASQASLLLLANATKVAANAHAALEARPGTIRKGTVFRVAANPTAVPPVTGGEYPVLLDAYAKRGDQTVSPQIEASIDGPSANLPLWSVGAPTLAITCTSKLFDDGSALPFTITTLRAGGGSSGQSDNELQRAAGAAWTGVYGPTVGALACGTLRSLGVSRYFDIEDTAKGGSWVYAADASWAWSSTWSAQIQRALREEWSGLGCKVRMGRVVNRIVRIEATVSLRDRGDLADPSSITTALQAACKSYFDDRPDWPIWRLSTLRGVLSRADRRILVCASVAVLDQDGRPVTEPAAPSAGSDLTHWYFADNALSVTYSGPS